MLRVCLLFLLSQLKINKKDMTQLLLFVLGIAIVLEGTVTSLPLVLIALILIAVHLKTSDVFFLAFLAGIILDLFLVRQVGESSVFFLLVLFCIFLYERKYEIESTIFVTFASMLSALIYLIIFPSPFRLVQIATVTLLAVVIFRCKKRFFSKQKSSYSML